MYLVSSCLRLLALAPDDVGQISNGDLDGEVDDGEHDGEEDVPACQTSDESASTTSLWKLALNSNYSTERRHTLVSLLATAALPTGSWAMVQKAAVRR